MTENQNKPVVFTRRNIATYGLGAVASTALISSANAAGTGVDVTAPVTALQTDGTSALTAVGTALLTLAGLAVVFKWVKAAFFS